MKTKAILTGFIAAFICASLNAQVFVGGTISTDMHRYKQKGTAASPLTSDFSFTFAPDVGKFFSDKFAAGVALDFEYTLHKVKSDPEFIQRSSEYGIVPFVRYYALRWNKFAIYGQGLLSFGYSIQSTENNKIKTTGEQSLKFSIYAFPGLSYDISDKLSLETGLSFMSFGYSYNHTKLSGLTTNQNSFGLSGDLSNITTLGGIRIGAIYKF
jgi:hypothetical protein